MARTPGEDSRYLILLAHIRDHETASFEELSSVLPDVEPKELADLLRKAEADDLVRRSSNTDGPIWKASSELLASRPSLERFAEAARWFDQPTLTATNDEPDGASAAAAETSKRTRAKHDWSSDPDAMVLLSELRGSRGLTRSELGRQLPHLEGHAVLRLLKRLRDAGHVQVVGETRNAIWRLPGKSAVATTKAAPRSEIEKRKDRTGGPNPRPDYRRLTEEELANVERFVAEYPGCSIREIAETVPSDGINRVRNLAEKLYSQRRLYRMKGRHYPGKDPNWE